MPYGTVVLVIISLGNNLPLNTCQDITRSPVQLQVMANPMAKCCQLKPLKGTYINEIRSNVQKHFFQ